MKLDKVPHQVIFLITAFLVSFILGLSFYKDNLFAFYAGLINLFTIAIATVITNIYRHAQNDLVYDQLEQELINLEEQEEEMYNYLIQANSIREEIETRINNLEQEKVYLLDYIGQLNLERRKLADDLHSLKIKEKYHSKIYANKYQEIAQLESQYDQLSFKLELLEITLEKKQQEFNNIEDNLQSFERDQQGLLQQKNQLIQEVQEIQTYYQEMVKKVDEIQQNRQNLEREFINEKREINNFKNVVAEQTQQQEKYNQILKSLEKRKQELDLNLRELELKSKQYSQIIEHQQEEINNYTKPYIRFKFFPEEWHQWINFYEQLNNDEQRIFKAILEENVELIKSIASHSNTSDQVLIENLNQKAFNIIGDRPFVQSEYHLIPKINDKYLSIFEELLVIKFIDTLSNKN